MMRGRIVPILVLASAGALGQKADSPVAAVGEFSNMRYTEEHAYGYSIQLWRAGETLFGLFLASEGLAGDTPTGLVENVRFDPATRKLSFQAKLTMGIRIDGDGASRPSQDLFEFDGRLNQNELAGTLKHSDRLQSPASAKTERVRLKRQAQTTIETFQNYQEWKTRTAEILKLRGPKW